MQKMVRPDCPQCLWEKSVEWNQRYYVRREADSNASFRWPQWQGKRVNHILSALLAEATQEHCSYCDGGFPMGSASRDTIDHFRPKETFWSEAFSWENLYLCCDCCQQCKGSKYSALLLRPDAEDFDFLRYFYLKQRNGEIAVNPLLVGTEEGARAQETINILGLNACGRPYARLTELEKFATLDSEARVRLFSTYNYRFILALVADAEEDDQAEVASLVPNRI